MERRPAELVPTRPWLDRADEQWRALSSAAVAATVCALLAVSTLPLLTRLSIGITSNDIRIYLRAAEAVIRGVIYRDVVFEYPPYTLPWFLPAYVVSHDLASFRLAFGLEMWAIDASIKAALLLYGVRARRGLRDLAPFFVYSLGTGALGHFLLQRYDLIPAAVSLAAVFAMAHGRPVLAGALVAFGAGIKVYPGLLFPVFAALAWQRGSAHLKRLVLGCSLVALPLIVAAPWLPWWQFASFHAERGLQVESLLASIVWALHFAGVPAGWEFIRTSNDVTGPVAAALVQPGRLFWCAASIACVVVASQAALRLGASTSHARSLPHVAALALLPVLAFVSTNTIFSPQFHVWLVPLAAAMFYARPTASDPAVQSPDGLPALALRAALCILLATFIVPVFYPHREYALGLGLFRTVMLVLRNLLLLYALGCLWWATRSMGRVPSRMSTQAFEPVR